MKITRLEIDGFRCFRDKRSLKFKEGRSLCLLGENGRGKTSVADALQFWSTANVPWTRREGVGLASLVHLDRDKALVEVRVDGVGVATRKLKGGKPSQLEAGAGPLAPGFQSEPLPILGHRTMAGFVDKTANDKRTELLEALGLEQLSEFRKGVRSAAQKLKRLEKEATQHLLEAERAWNDELGGESLGGLLQRLSTEAQLNSEIQGEGDLQCWAPESSPTQQADAALPRIEALAAADAALREAPSNLWATAISDQAAAEQRGLGILLETGQELIETTTEDRCPLCLLEQDRSELLASVTKRAADLAAANERFHEAESQLQGYQSALNGLIRALESLVSIEHPTVADHKETLGATHQALLNYREGVDKAISSRSILPAHTPGIPESVLNSLKEDALTAPVNIGPALLRLSKLKGLLLALQAAKAATKAAQGKREAGEVAANIADEHVERAVRQALDRINVPLARYYEMLVGNSGYSDLHLTYTEGRAGGIEFEFKWNSRHSVRPPQKIMSESQLNALGLALFLARLKADPPEWRTMVLDDVVTSFDSVHQTRLIRLLNSEFADWQVLLLTHDQQLVRTVRAEAPEWILEKIVAWSIREGPSFGSANMRVRLKEKLDAGEPAEELGGLARQAIEEALERPVRRMGLKIRHDPGNIYTADEYRRALVAGLTEGKFPRADADVLKRLQTDGSISNRACHYRNQEPGVTEQDLRVLLEDLEALDHLFRCDTCGKKVWDVPHQGSTRCQCECGALSCA